MRANVIGLELVIFITSMASNIMGTIIIPNGKTPLMKIIPILKPAFYDLTLFLATISISDLVFSITISAYSFY
jgi:hypothetical protein